MVAFPSGTLDFRFHTGRDPVPEHPDLGAFAHQGVSEEQPEFAFRIVVVIKELRKQKMRCNRDESPLHGKAAVASCGDYVFLYISGIRGADVDDWAKGSERPLFFGLNVF